LLLLAAALALAIAMTVTTRNMVAQVQAEQQQLTTQGRDIRARLSHAPEEEHELRNRIALFQEMQAHGLIGQEERRNWVEAMDSIKATRRLFDFQYEIAPQKTLSANGNYELMASAMSLRMPLLHENDLLGFLTDLQNTVHARLLVRDCSIDRAAQAQEDDGLTAQLQADCTIDWITAREKRQ
jgi:hypothetical protein